MYRLVEKFFIDVVSGGRIKEFIRSLDEKIAISNYLLEIICKNFKTFSFEAE